MNPAELVEKVDALDRAGVTHHLDKVPLTCRVYRDPDGKPLKTQLTLSLPMLSRRERRELLRRALKAQKKSRSI
jgi:hypothetical protein